jgi:hypothetical protein
VEAGEPVEADFGLGGRGGRGQASRRAEGHYEDY